MLQHYAVKVTKIHEWYMSKDNTSNPKIRYCRKAKTIIIVLFQKTSLKLMHSFRLFNNRLPLNCSTRYTFSGKHSGQCFLLITFSKIDHMILDVICSYVHWSCRRLGRNQKIAVWGNLMSCSMNMIWQFLRDMHSIGNKNIMASICLAGLDET